MAKYDPLYEFLSRQSCSRIVMTFSEVARIIGDDGIRHGGQMRRIRIHLMCRRKHGSMLDSKLIRI